MQYIEHELNLVHFGLLGIDYYSAMITLQSWFVLLLIIGLIESTKSQGRGIVSIAYYNLGKYIGK